MIGFIVSKRTGKEINCLKCNSEFYASNWQLLRNIGKYCSKICSKGIGIYKAIEASRGTLKPGAKKGKNFLCLICKKEFYVAKNRVDKGKVRYCSRSCLAKDLLPKHVVKYGFQKLNKPLHKYKIIKIDGKQVREHRWIMEQHLGRKLQRWEHVHHINDDSSDNRLENLEVLSNADHQRKEYQFRKSIISSS
jgi:hypothetical protein